MPKIKLPDAYFSKILILQNFVVVKYLVIGVPKGKMGITVVEGEVMVLQPSLTPLLSRTTSNLRIIWSKSIVKFSVDQ